MWQWAKGLIGGGGGKSDSFPATSAVLNPGELPRSAPASASPGLTPVPALVPTMVQPELQEIKRPTTITNMDIDESAEPLAPAAAMGGTAVATPQQQQPIDTSSQDITGDDRPDFMEPAPRFDDPPIQHLEESEKATATTEPVVAAAASADASKAISVDEVVMTDAPLLATKRLLGMRNVIEEDWK